MKCMSSSFWGAFFIIFITMDLSFAWSPKPGGTRITGRIVYESGETLKFSDMIYADLTETEDGNPALAIRYKNTRRVIPIEKISYISIVNRTCTDAGLRNSEIEMSTEAGDTIHAILLDSLGQFKVSYIDEITKQQQTANIYSCAKASPVRMIHFDEVGSLAFNPRSLKYYPASYRFDPYTGEKLIKRMPE